jgi:hypothetical protein
MAGKNIVTSHTEYAEPNTQFHTQEKVVELQGVDKL